MPPESSHDRGHDVADDDEFCIRKRDTGSNSRVHVWLLLGAAGILFTACVVGLVIFLVISNGNNATAARLPGSWKGQFVIAGQVIDANYVFENGGEFRQETLNHQGQIIDVAKGRWRVVMGEIEIDWDNGAIERATITWTDDRTMEYRIVDHDDAIQIGVIATLRRR